LLDADTSYFVALPLRRYRQRRRQGQNGVRRGLKVCTALMVLASNIAGASSPTGVFVSAGPLFSSDASLTSAPIASGSAFVAGAWTGAVFASDGTWQPAIPFQASRYGGTAQRLQDGRIAIIGTASTNATVPAEVVDPVLGTTVSSGPMLVKRYGSVAIPRPDGKLLVWGGFQSGTSWPPLSQAEVFDPASATFASGGTALPGRWNAALTLLADGRYLLTGGSTADQVIQQIAAVYNPATNTTAPTGAMAKLRTTHSAVLLDDGRVLIFGGLTYVSGSQDVADSAEVYTPSSNTFATVPHMVQHRMLHVASLLPDGQVLIVGGIGQYGQYIANAEIFDPNTNAFTALPPMLHPRKSATAVSLGGGRVLIAGGSDAQGTVEESEIFEYDHILADSFEPTH